MSSDLKDLKDSKHDIDNKQLVIEVKPYDWIIKDGQGEDEDQTHIHAWCMDRESNPYLLRITDFGVNCHLELPRFTIRNNAISWSKSRVANFMDYLDNRLGEDKPIMSRYKITKTLYYYQAEAQVPMILLVFKNSDALRHACNIFNKIVNVPDLGELKFNVHESDISSIRKLLTVRRCKYTQCFQAKAVKVPRDEVIGKLKHEYYIKWQDLTPLPEEKSFNTYPNILSFDIETYSDKHKAMPQKLESKHVAYLISCVFQRLGKPETRKRYGIIFGDCDEVPNNIIADCKIIRCISEISMIKAFMDLVNELDPEVVTGYNILGYDYPYLDARLKRMLQDWIPMGRLINEKTIMTSKTWESAAYGTVTINNLNMSGRINVDMLPIVKRGYKLKNYQLKTVSAKFKVGNKHDVTPIEMFQIYEKLKKCMTNRKLFPNDAKVAESFNKAKAEMTRSMAYCIMDSELPLNLFTEKLHTWHDLNELSSVVGVTITELFTRGQQVRCLSQIYDEAWLQGYVLTRRMTSPIKGFAGGAVRNPITGLHENVVCLDFASLYPSIMRAFNISYETLVPPEMYDQVPNHLCHVIEFTQEETINGDAVSDDDEGDNDDEEADEKKNATSKAKTAKKQTKTVNYKFKYLRSPKGIIPTIVEKLVLGRKAVKKLMKKYGENTVDYIILNCRQNALKVSANSLFGFQGVQNGKLSFMEGAMSITAKGRELVATVDKYISQKYLGSKQIYGDSVTGDTPLMIKGPDSKVHFVSIAQLPELLRLTIKYKHTNDKDRSDISNSNIEVWSDKGWTRIKQFIRHKCDKELYRVVTSTGIVDVTSDHSLLDSRGKEIKPKDVKVGDKLLHHDLPILLKQQVNSDNKSICNNKLQIAIDYYYQYNKNKNTCLDIDANGDYTVYQADEEPNTIKKIIPLGPNPKGEYVYDLETENHHFAAGIGRMIVHNTDSVMFDLGIKDSKLVNEIGKKLAYEISGDEDKKIPGIFESYVLSMEFEKGMRLLCFKKKKYAAVLIDEKGEHKYNDDDILKKGIDPARRDKCQLHLELYNEVLRAILMKQPMDVPLKTILTTINNMFANKYPPSMFGITQELGAHYKSKTYHMKLFSDYLKSIGLPANPGDRLEYVVIDDPKVKYRGERMRLVEQMYDPRSNKPREKDWVVGYSYYLEKLFCKPINQLMSVGYYSIIEQLPEIKFRKTNRHKMLDCSNIMMIIVQMLEMGKNPWDLYDCITHSLQAKQLPCSLSVAKPKMKIKLVNKTS